MFSLQHCFSLLILPARDYCFPNDKKIAFFRVFDHHILKFLVEKSTDLYISFQQCIERMLKNFTFNIFGVKFGEIALWLIATHATLQSWENLKLN
jgi:hypothetical protein